MDKFLYKKEIRTFIEKKSQPVILIEATGMIQYFNIIVDFLIVYLI